MAKAIVVEGLGKAYQLGNLKGNNFPKISLITPCYNQGEYIEETILSIFNQNYPNLEYIVIDGGSNDNTVEIIKKHSSKITYWISEPDNGMYHALQKGFEQSTGEIMGWINSDDVLYPGSLFTVAETFGVNINIQWITGVPTVIDKFGRMVDFLPLKKWSKFNFLLREDGTIQQESTYWTRELWIKAGASMSLDYKLAGDFELWSRFFLFEPLYSLKAPLGGFRLRPGKQLSSVFFYEYINEVNKIIEQMTISDSDINILKKIKLYKRYSWLLKSDSIRKRYLDLYDYPEIIYYDKAKNIFLKAAN